MSFDIATRARSQPATPEVRERQPDDALGPYNFAIEVLGVATVQCMEISGLKVAYEFEERWEGGNNVAPYRAVRKMKYEPLRIKKGFYGRGSDFADWVGASLGIGVHHPPMIELAIIVFDDSFAEVCRYNVYGAFIAGYTGPTFDASATGKISFEEIEVRYDYFTYEAS